MTAAIGLRRGVSMNGRGELVPLPEESEERFIPGGNEGIRTPDPLRANSIGSVPTAPSQYRRVPSCLGSRPCPFASSVGEFLLVPLSALARHLQTHPSWTGICLWGAELNPCAGISPEEIRPARARLPTRPLTFHSICRCTKLHGGGAEGTHRNSAVENSQGDSHVLSPDRQGHLPVHRHRGVY